MGLAEPLEVIAAVLAALSGMYQHGLRRFASPNCRQQRIQCELTAERCLHRPAHDLARVQVNDGRQIQPALQLRMYVMSVTHALSGASTVNCRCRWLGAMIEGRPAMRRGAL